jgi:ATP-dependent RNA helicase DHX57
MVKKGQSKGPKPGSGGGKKPAPAPAADDSFIIFSNSDKDPKPKKTNAAGAPGLSGPALAGEGPPKPTAKQIIGGASWTGKLPVNMLSEHCQKQKWEKPEYTMSKNADGYSAMVILKAKNSKTQELVQVGPLKLPPTHKHLAVKPTALEARHFAATYGLFRVCSMRNIHMMLPPDYRNLWKGEFEVLKKEDVREGKGWMYEADPFAALREREEAKAVMEKKRNEREKAKEKAANTPGGPGGLPLRSAGAPNGAGSGSNNIHRGWTRVPKIEMGKRTRASVEALIRKYALWNPHDVKLSQFQKHSIINDFKNLEFRASHIQEAVEECKDREETLEWLLIHVPEDDLPRWALPEGYVAGISMASNDLKREGAIKRLAEAGYASDLCKQIYDSSNGDEARAAEALQGILMSSGTEQATDTVEEWHSDSQAELDEAWEEELSSLQSVFGENFSRASSDVCRVRFKPANRGLNTPVDPVLKIRRSKNYPHTVPIISIEATLPAYLRLSIMKKALLHATETLLGEQMLFFMIDWLEQNFYGIVENPGKLREVSAAASTVSEVRPPKRRSHRTQRHPAPIKWVTSSRSVEDWKRKQQDPKLQKMIAGRRTLPAWEMREIIIDTVNSHQVTIISGETGSGKSTQSAQFVLDDLYQRGFGDATKIICTQPRRISALGLADRVSDERCSSVGQEVGYIIRGESKASHNTKITFVTTGVLLRRLQTSGGSSDDVVASLADVSHVIIDEVHERSLDTDFLLVLLRDVLRKRSDLKLILMSATLDAGVFEDYFRNDGKVGRVEISGRTYPVEDYYLDDVIRMTGFSPTSYGGRGDNNDDAETAGMDTDVAKAIQSIGMRINYDLIAQTVREIDAELTHLNQEGGILIFMPGVMEITRTLDSLRSIPKLHALPLHAGLQSVEQRRVFPHAPSGKRKVVVATNVAETSITIDDIVAVIDSGRVKETSYDPQNNMRKLEEVWASRAACKQRRGRAGRVQAGKCYKLYTRNAEMTKMMERPEPEIRRVPLEQLCLSVRAMGIIEVGKFLASALTPPESMAVDGAMDLLGRMGALDGDDLTALGRHLSMIPADLRCGKLMVYGAMFGCLDACVTIAAILTVKSPFVSPQDKRDEAKAARATFSQGHGDLIADLKAFERWDEMLGDRSYPQREIRNWCSDNFLAYQTLSDISSNRTQYLTSLREIGFIPARASPSHSRNNTNTALIRSLIAGAFNPQLARIDFPDKKFAQSVSGAVELDPEARTIKYFNQENGRVFVHPSSTLFDAQGFPGNSAFMSYFNKMATSKVFIRDLTREFTSSPFMI